MKKIFWCLFMSLFFQTVNAQQSTTSSGGEAIGVGGTSSYSVGQIVYTTNLGTNGNIAQGVQQAFEISTTISLEETNLNLNLSVYPNPTTSFLTLKTNNNISLNYQLVNLQGKVIETKKVKSKITNINLVGQPKATYYLNIIKNNEIVKTFKIIKQ